MKNRIPQDEQHKLFYEIYDAILPLPLPWDKKYRGFEWLIEDAGLDVYPIDGITVDALRTLAKNDWDPTGKIKRGHGHNRLERRQRAHAIFCGKIPRDEAFDFFMEHDKVTICTNAENGKSGIGHWSDVIPLPIELFGWRTGWGLNVTKARAAELSKILESLECTT